MLKLSQQVHTNILNLSTLIQTCLFVTLSTILQHCTHNETVTHCCSPMALCAVGCIQQAKLPSLDPPSHPRVPSVTILSASSVQTLVHCVVKYSRPPDLMSSYNVSLPFAWITGPATDPSLEKCCKGLGI